MNSVVGKIRIVENHNEALYFWTVASLKAQSKLKLLTFDFHTDFRPSVFRFNNAVDDLVVLRQYKSLRRILKNFRTDKSYSRLEYLQYVKKLEKLIKNDEQINEGYDLGILSDALLILPNDSDKEILRNDDEIPSSWFRYSDSKIQELLFSDLSNFILDIDLDFFVDSSLLRCDWWNVLYERAVMVTIAKEPKYYKACCDSKSVSNEEALDILRGALLGNK